MSIDATYWMIENKNLFLLEIGILNARRRIGDRSSISSGSETPEKIQVQDLSTRKRTPELRLQLLKDKKEKDELYICRSETNKVSDEKFKHRCPGPFA
ncbi:hypothetical protein KQX54_014949 [Cotesia glomerata]|uniref:Uncharacterized protein n=1 Tax=Cotesia glomerata TaxID=32391 RepID=A0AAV7IKU0_COTGL|nr:hypothetical protein KQX54_014949 [Cotesia glomerata]